MGDQPALARRLTTTDAVAIGLGSMMGAGVFAAFTPAAAAAGSGLLIGLAVAAFVAFCNATSSAQLAAAYPTSGGTYIYGRERLGPWPGYLAGWGFVIGKTASAAAMAMTFAAYVAPLGWERPVAIAAVLVIAAVNSRGITRTARLTKLIVTFVLIALAIGVAAAWRGGSAAPMNAIAERLFADGWYGIMQSAGLLFFAFAGYARIATMGEEVRDPRRTIPRAIGISLLITVVVYAAIAVTLLLVLGPDGIAATPTPLTDAAAASDWAWAAPVLHAGAGIASLGALLAVFAGLGRTSLAMARERDLPTWFAAVHPRHLVPYRADAALTVVICVVIAVADLRDAIGFSSFGVLLYYFVANVAAFTQPKSDRRYPKALQVIGALTCVALVATLPVTAVVTGITVIAVGVLLRVIRLRSAGGR